MGSDGKIRGESRLATYEQVAGFVVLAGVLAVIAVLVSLIVAKAAMGIPVRAAWPAPGGMAPTVVVGRGEVEVAVRLYAAGLGVLPGGVAFYSEPGGVVSARVGYAEVGGGPGESMWLKQGHVEEAVARWLRSEGYTAGRVWVLGGEGEVGERLEGVRVQVEVLGRNR